MNDSVDKDYRIHAYIDDQMDADEREAFIKELEQHPELRREVCDLHYLRSAVRHAYAEEYMPAASCRKTLLEKAGTHAMQGLAALLILMSGVALGWYSSAAMNMPYELVRLDPAIKMQAQKVILHIGEADETKFTRVLATADRLIKQYSDAGVEVEVVANAGGLDLLDADVSPHAEKVRAMIDQHNNLSFVACSNALENMERQGRYIRLIDHTRKAPSALEHIVQRLQQGWQYIKV